ncbi:MAG: ChaN family lipoprotein [Elusimicrobiota bacterium]
MQITALALASALVGWTPPMTSAPRVPQTHPASSAAPAPAPIVAAPAGGLITVDALGAALAGATLVAVGEKHDSLAHHQVQTELLSLLAERVPATAVGFEMISYEDQPKLDDFAAGRTSEADFAVWWKKVWGFDYAMYKPIFDEARKQGLPLYALNAPSALVKAVARGGLSSLPHADRARLPSVVQESTDPRYRDFVLQSVSSHGPMMESLMQRMGIDVQAFATTDPVVIERRIQAMAVWNETMGEQAARRVAAGHTLFLVAGQGHVLYKAGVPESARRRGVAATVVVLPYPFEPEDGLGVPEMLARLRDPAQDDIQQADYFRLLPW